MTGAISLPFSLSFVPPSQLQVLTLATKCTMPYYLSNICCRKEKWNTKHVGEQTLRCHEKKFHTQCTVHEKTRTRLNEFIYLAKDIYKNYYTQNYPKIISWKS